MAKYVKTDVVVGDVVKSDVNVQLGLIEDSIGDTLSLSGGAGNSMTSDLDMNSNDLLNVSSVATDSLIINGVVATTSLSTFDTTVNYAWTGTHSWSQNATFTGDIYSSQTYQTVAEDIGGGAGFISGYNTTYDVGVKHKVIGATAAISYGASGLEFFSEGSQAAGTLAARSLLLDTSQNATFAGDVTAAGDVSIGVSDTTAGSLIAYGAGTGNTSGGEVRLHKAADYDTTNDYWSVDASEGNFRIFQPVNGVSIQITEAGDTTFGGDLKVAGTSAIWSSGTGTPESVVTAPVGSMFTRTDGGAGTTLYVKETGTGNTGWVGK